MKQRKVIDTSQLPTRLPIVGTLVWYLVLDHFHAPAWLWGAFGVLFLILWIGCIVAVVKQESVELKELL